MHIDDKHSTDQDLRGTIVSWCIWYYRIPLGIRHYMIIIETCYHDILESKVIQYGLGAQHKITVTTIRASMIASNISYVRLSNVKYEIPELDRLEQLCTEFMQYGYYSANWHNCIHFIQHITGNSSYLGFLI